MDQNARNINSQYQKLLTITAVLILSWALFCLTSYAQTEVQDKSLKSYKLPPRLKNYLQEKYKGQIKEVSSALLETPQGPRGYLDIRGHIKPRNVESASEDKDGRARAIAKAFLKDEAELLGLSDLNELREYKLVIDKGYVHIYYVRYIDDLLFDKFSLHIAIGPDETITYFSASLVPAPSELYQAVAKKMITESEVQKIIEGELTAHGFTREDVSLSSIHKTALPTSPYVVWTAVVDLKNLKKKHDTPSWVYEVNAFTGEILHKPDMH